MSDLRAQHVVTAADLADELAGGGTVAGDPLVLLDVRAGDDPAADREAFDAGHLPGAVPVTVAAHLQGRPEGHSGRRPLPPLESLQDHARSWGISAGTRVVVYDDADGTRAARAWWVLRWAGVASVRVLDGGLRAWQADGHPVSTDPPTPRRGDVTLTGGHLPQLDADQAARLAERGALLDARGPDGYAQGHIPGARSVPAGDNRTEDGRLRDEASLRARFGGLGVPEDVGDGATVGVYCGGSTTAAHQALVLTSLGIPTALYVGSFSAWSSDPDRPVAVGPDDPPETGGTEQ